MAKFWTNNLAIWSHCNPVPRKGFNLFLTFIEGAKKLLKGSTSWLFHLKIIGRSRHLFLMDIVHCEQSILSWYYMYTIAYHLGQYRPLSTSTKELHRVLAFLKRFELGSLSTRGYHWPSERSNVGRQMNQHNKSKFIT